MTIEVGKTEISVKPKKKRMPMWQRVSGIAIAFVCAMLVTAMIILVSGKSPIEAFMYIFQGAFSNIYFFGETVIKTCPLLIGALGICICYRTGLTSVGAEGQMAIGGLMATIAGCYITGLNPVIHIIVCIIFAMVGGGIWCGIAGYLKAKLGVSEVINTIMLNYVATFTVSYMCSGPIQEGPPYTFIQSPMLLESAFLPKLVNGTRIHLGVVIAVVSVFIVYYLLWMSPLGYQMRAVGYNQMAARTSGINVKMNMVLAMFLSGAFCGLAGGIEIMGLHHRLIPGFTAELGFDAMAIGLLGGLHPIGVTLASFFFGALRAGATTMQRAMQIPAALVDVIQGLVLIFVLAQSVFSNFVVKITTKKRA